MLGLLLGSILLILLLGELYVAWLKMMPKSPWLSILTCHLVVASILMLMVRPVRRQLKFNAAKGWVFVPATLVLLGSLCLAWLVPLRSSGNGYRLEWFYSLASVSAIPFAEKIVFRGGVSAVLMNIKRGVWPSYFSAVVFAAAHTTPSWSRLIDLQIGLPLGPFLLGLCCEFFTRKTQSLLPGIAFHCACNSTVLIFSYWSPGWLERLSALYIG